MRVVLSQYDFQTLNNNYGFNIGVFLLKKKIGITKVELQVELSNNVYNIVYYLAEQ